MGERDRGVPYGGNEETFWITQARGNPGGKEITMDEIKLKPCPMLRKYLNTGLTPEQCETAKVIIESAFSDDTSKAERIRELLKADRDGRLVVLPCKVGDTLFRVFAGEILEHKVGNMRYLAIQGRWDIDTTPFCSYVESSMGKTIFLTREEAEKALEAMKDV